MACVVRQASKAPPRMSRAKLSEMKSLQKENDRLKKIVAELKLDKYRKGKLGFFKTKA